MVTSETNRTLLQKASAVGVNAIMEKPFTGDQLAGEIDVILNSR